MSHSMNKEATALLTRARDYIAQGWTKGTYFRCSRGFHCSIDSVDVAEQCLVGALFRAYAVNFYREREYWYSGPARLVAAKPVLQEVVCRLTGEVPKTAAEGAMSLDNLMRWNDAKKRTQKQVIARLERAIAHPKRDHPA